MVAALSSLSKSQRMIELKFAHAELMQLQNLRMMLQQQHDLQQLSEVTGVKDHEFLRRLTEAGFNARNIHAIVWLPVAMVAWASHGVTQNEAQAAGLVRLYALFTGNAGAIELFRSWLREKPSEKLIRLWEDYVRLQSNPEDGSRSQMGEAIHYVARKVAQASGGLLGLGQISAAEQRVLDRIRDVYQLPARKNWD